MGRRDRRFRSALRGIASRSVVAITSAITMCTWVWSVDSSNSRPARGRFDLLLGHGELRRRRRCEDTRRALVYGPARCCPRSRARRPPSTAGRHHAMARSCRVSAAAGQGIGEDEDDVQRCPLCGPGSCDRNLPRAPRQRVGDGGVRCRGHAIRRAQRAGHERQPGLPRRPVRGAAGRRLALALAAAAGVMERRARRAQAGPALRAERRLDQPGAGARARTVST